MDIVNRNSEAVPKVSVIIPSYNRASLVTRAIDSVLVQTYPYLEVVVVDDGSTDNTTDVVGSYADERVKCVKHRKNRGVSAARNAGINVSRGEFIGFLDSDDEWLPEKLERQVEKFKSASVNTGLVYGGYEVIDSGSNKTISWENPKKRGPVFRYLLKEDFIGSPTPLVKRECFEKAGCFDEELQFCEDWDMWLRIAQYYEFDYVGETVAKFYVSQFQTTSDSYRALQNLSKFWAKHHTYLSEEPAILAHHFKWAAQRYLIEREYGTARTYFANAVRARPLDVRLYSHLIAALIAPGLYRSVWKTQFMIRIRKAPVSFRGFIKGKKNPPKSSWKYKH
ncbi:glycosyltransferase family 2 protein [Chloroflexota bacterium]